jgi:cysteine-rich repeat protein
VKPNSHLPFEVDPWTGSYHGTIDPDTDVDCVSLSLLDGDVLSATLDNGAGTCTMKANIQLVDLDGEARLANETSGPEVCPVATTGIHASGVYFVCAAAALAHHSVFDYTLRLHVTRSTCGDGIVAGEACDDGNAIAGDLCSAQCALEVTPVDEVEPNDDDSPSVGGVGTEGNDFSVVNANGPYTRDTVVRGALGVVGDEDVFALHNTGPATTVDLSTGTAFLGDCTENTDTVLTVRSAAGAALAQNDDAKGVCSRLTAVPIPAGGTVYVHVSEHDDHAAIPAYVLGINFH